MKLFELTIWLGVGALCVCLGLLIWKKQKITLIHSYHYKRVAAVNVGAYTKRMGQGTLIIGLGSVVAGLINFIANTHYGFIAFVAGFVVGFGIMMRTQWKYNGGLFSR